MNWTKITLTLPKIAALAVILLQSVGLEQPAFAGWTGIFGGGPFYKNPGVSIPEIANSGYTEAIVWNISVNSTGDLNFNGEFPLCSGGAYVGAATHPDFAENMARLKQGAVKRVTFSIGSSNYGDWENIKALVNAQGTGTNSILYQNFQALKSAIPALDALDFDDENSFDQSSTVQFSVMLGNLGYKVMPDAYDNSSYWVSVTAAINSQSPGTVDGVHLQCYAGGSGNSPCSFANFGNIPVYPGLWDLGDSPSQVQSIISGWHSSCNIAGAFMWLYDDFVGNGEASQYASAINTGVGNSAGSTNLVPVIFLQPASQSVFLGGTVTFSYEADSAYPLTNQWYEDGIPLPGQTNATLVLTNVQISGAGDYNVIIGNGIGSTNSTAAHLVVLTAQPSVISWQSPQEISGASDVSTLGSYFGSWAPWDGSANTEPVDGVTFEGNSDLSSLNDWGNSPGGKGGGPYFASPNTANANYNSLLAYGQYGGDGYSYVIDWGGMMPGHTYLLEFWVEDARVGATGPRWETLSGGAIGTTSSNLDASAETAYSNPLGSTPAGNPGSYIIGTFAANTNGSEEILVTPGSASGSASAQVNLMLVRDITGVTPVQPHLSSVHLSGTTLVMTGNNGTTGQQFIVLASTNLALPLSQWTPVTTNTFTGSSFSVTNTVNPGARQGFYRLRVQGL
jgi:hypothetical protein